MLGSHSGGTSALISGLPTVNASGLPLSQSSSAGRFRIPGGVAGVWLGTFPHPYGLGAETLLGKRPHSPPSTSHPAAAQGPLTHLSPL